MRKFSLLCLLLLCLCIISCSSTKAYYGYVLGVSDTYIIADVSGINGEQGVNVRIDVGEDHGFYQFATVRIDALPDDFILSSGTYEEGYPQNYTYVISNYKNIRLSDWKKGEPLYG